MAVSTSLVTKFVIGDRQANIVDVTFDSSYPAGGEAVTAATLFLENEITAIFGGVARDPDTHDNAFLCDYDASAKKLILFGGDNNNTADGPLIELSGMSTPITDASPYTARLLVIGK